MKLLALFLVAVCASSLQAQPAKSGAPVLSMSRYQGSSITIDPGYGTQLNSASSLRREWMILVDPSAPLQIAGEAGVDIGSAPGSGSNLGRYQYSVSSELIPTEPIRAYELRVHILALRNNAWK